MLMFSGREPSPPIGRIVLFVLVLFVYVLSWPVSLLRSNLVTVERVIKQKYIAEERSQPSHWQNGTLCICMSLSFPVYLSLQFSYRGEGYKAEVHSGGKVPALPWAEWYFLYLYVFVFSCVFVFAI